MNNTSPIHIIGGGLAGSEAAWQAANLGAPVILHEMRPTRTTDAHQTDNLAELVCSNSFRSDDADNNAVGLLHAEMRLLNSLIMQAADQHQIPAGGALAVDRHGFSAQVTDTLNAHPLITIARGEVKDLQQAGWDNIIIATGPLTSENLSTTISNLTGAENLAFFDAIAPIIHKDSIDFEKVWFQSRYDKEGPGGTGKDYINCAMNEAEYNHFIDALLEGEKTDFKEWEKNTPYFDGCLPIEVMAERGRETLRHGPMKPVGLTNPHKQEKPHAVVQLRQDNALGTLWNMVGFQTKLKYGAQTDIFRLIPGLEGAVFARLGGLHRNSFLNSPNVLDDQLRLRTEPRLRFAGQITGVEGYVESASLGLIAGRMAAADQTGTPIPPPPIETAHGALINHITGGHLSSEFSGGIKSFQPMNINFGLIPPMEAPTKDETGQRLRGKAKGRVKKQLMTKRARAELAAWKKTHFPNEATNRGE